MEIKEVRIKFGMTQNLGDYTNCRPEIELVAQVSATEDISEVVAELNGIAADHIHGVIDDELEMAGRQVKYYEGELLQVSRNATRKCIAIYPVGTTLPNGSTWKTKDYWNSEHYSYDLPAVMRPHTARKFREKLAAEYPEYDVVVLPHDLIPPMPDDGPEPAWHEKDLESYLNGYLCIPEAYWEEIGELDHVTKDYLKTLYHHNVERKPLDERLAIIRENRSLEAGLAAEDDDDYDDYDEDDAF